MIKTAMVQKVLLLCTISLFCLGTTMVSGLSMPPSNLEQLGQRKKKYYGGAGIGRFILDENVGQENAVQCLYDMVLVERVQGRPPTDSGLFVPQEDLPKLHVCRGKDERERGGRGGEREGEREVHTYTRIHTWICTSIFVVVLGTRLYCCSLMNCSSSSSWALGSFNTSYSLLNLTNPISF